MPRRSGDQGSKPFEFRTGVGGLPTLGGMFRSGDPAMTPPHKFHLLVNMRRTPGGMITRPGLGLEFNTGVQECINGLTEDAGEQGGALMLYPGSEARPGNGSPAFNPASFRAIFPESSPDYSEFAFALYGQASVVRGNTSPVLAYLLSAAGVSPTFLSRPFIFRGQAVQFAMVDRAGTDTVALLGINLAGRSFLQASDCWRDSARPNDGTTPACPGAAGQPTPPGSGDPPLWPFQHPVGSANVLAYFDNPFGTGAWRPDAAATIDDLTVDLILTMQERTDDILTGTPGVNEVLYFVARQSEVTPVLRRLVRWDGAQQTTEFSAIPDNLRPGLSHQPYGPYLGSGDLDAGPRDWAAIRTEAGTWSVIGGVGWTLGVSVATYHSAFFFDRALSWGGRGHLLTYGEFGCGIISVGPYIHAHAQGATEFDAAYGSHSCTPLTDCETGDVPYPFDAVVSGSRCYVIGTLNPGAPDDSGERRLFVGDFRDPLNSIANVRLTTAGNFNPGGPAEVWIQAVGGRVYVGGRFAEFMFPFAVRHAVYDVTDAVGNYPVIDDVVSGCVEVYRVLDTEQPEDGGEGGHQSERYSRGALPSVPNDDNGGEGFQAS